MWPVSSDTPNRPFSIQAYAKAVKRRERLSGETLKAFDAVIVLAPFEARFNGGNRRLVRYLRRAAMKPCLVTRSRQR